MAEAFLIGGARTPVGRYGGSLSTVRPDDLAALTITAALTRAGIDPETVDLSEIEVRTDAWGRPSIRLHGAIARAMDEYDVLVSLSHDPAADVAVAFVVLQHSQEAHHA